MRLAAASLMLLLATPGGALAQDGADIRVLAANKDRIWVGERVDIHLELWTEALSFSGQSFTLPEVRGGYLLQPDSTTIKMSERRDGATWQGLRYTFNLYPQRQGELEVPSFEVRFSTSAGYGSEPRPHIFRTQPVSVEAALPPGARQGELLVTTSDFKLDAAWDPAPTDGSRMALMTGDALVLTVKREAVHVPGMVFEPLPEFTIDGLGVYVDKPTVNDRVSRGDLTGMRSDRVTLICERPGVYQLPSLTFQWWDPQHQQLRLETVPGPGIDVVQNPALAVAASREGTAAGFDFDKRYLWILLAVALAWWPGRVLSKAAAGWLARELRPTRLAQLNPRGIIIAGPGQRRSGD